MEKMYILLFFYVVTCLGIIGSEVLEKPSDAEDGQFPFQVSLRINNIHQCSGAIINSKTIFTVADCLIKYFQFKIGMYCVAGTINLNKGGIRLEINKLITYYWYGKDRNHNDFGVVLLQTGIIFDSNIQPIEVNWNGMTPGKSVASGWGLSGPTASTRVNNLMYTTLDILSVKECSKHIEGLDMCMMCATTYSKQFCIDSGGPLVVEKKLVGIMMYGITNCIPDSVNVVVQLKWYKVWLQKSKYI